MCGRICKNCLYCAVIVGVLAWIFTYYPLVWYRRHFNEVPPVSYDGRITFNQDNLMIPETLTDIQTIVREAYESDPPRKVRVLGDGHSWSEIAQTPDILISLARYYGIVGEPDKTNLRATFKAGTSLSNISLLLEERGLAMINLGSVAGQSIAGAISTGTHGTGKTIGNLAALVTAMKFVSGTGEVVEVSQDDEDPSLFRAAQVNIGMFGVITEVTLKVKEKFYLQEYRTSKMYDLDGCLDNIETLVSSATYVKLWVEFYHNFCILYQTEITSDTEVTDPLFPHLTYYMFAVSTRITRLIPPLTPYFMFLVDYVGFYFDSHRVDISYKIFNDYFELPIHQEGEVIFPFEDTAKNVRAIRDIIIDNKIPVNYITEVRFVKGDNIWLSPEYTENGTDFCAITLTIFASPSTVLDYFDKVYEAIGERVHWGKHFTPNRDTLGQWYPKFDDFLEKRAEMDPKGIFLNDFLEEPFGPVPAPAAGDGGKKN